jgi:hypothetical protein
MLEVVTVIAGKAPADATPVICRTRLFPLSPT